MSRILVVEDNPDFRRGAEEYFRGQKDVEVSYAADDVQATQEGIWHNVQGALIDCFFPYLTGSGDISMGLLVVGQMRNEDPTETRIRDKLKVLEPYIDLGDSDMMKYARFFIETSQHSDVSQSPVFLAIRKVGETIGKPATTHIAKETLGLIYREDRAPRDYYGALLKAIEESEANQPFGVAVAHLAHGKGIPFVLVTSTYHHDILTQPIQNYAGRKGWKLVDCYQGKEKATPEFWKKAYEALLSV